MLQAGHVLCSKHDIPHVTNKTRLKYREDGFDVDDLLTKSIAATRTFFPIFRVNEKNKSSNRSGWRSVRDRSETEDRTRPNFGTDPTDWTNMEKHISKSPPLRAFPTSKDLNSRCSQKGRLRSSSDRLPIHPYILCARWIYNSGLCRRRRRSTRT